MGDDRRKFSFRPALLGVLLFALPLAAPALAATGDIGDTCLSDGTCHNGACLGGPGGLCVPCGMPGQLACPNRDPDKPPECHLSGWGYVPVATAAGTVCINPGAKDCGHVGEPACDRDGRDGCYYGVSVATRRGDICVACGDIGEACCTGTERVCDTGTCQGGICRLDRAKAAKDRAEEATLVDRFARTLVACDFGAAAKAVADAEAKGFGSAAKMRQRYQETLSAERAARDAYASGRAENARANKLMAARPYDDALKAYRAARTLFERARQRTECAATRKAIAAAIFDVGANELIAIGAVERAANAKAAAAPPSAAPPKKKGIDPIPAGAHPCLDPSIKADRGMTSFQLGLGGGGATYYLKGPYICGKRYIGASFETFDGATNTIYRCQQQGNRYVNCKVVQVNHIIGVYKVKDGTDYHYKCGNGGTCWMHIFPRKGN